MRTAAVVIIGDEILSGKFADENGPYLIGRLRSLGVALRRLVTIGDAHDDIAEEVLRCSRQYDLVFTTGGVGPTHDDITMEGIAGGFGVPVEMSPRLIEILDGFGLTDAANRRMALVPRGSELIEHPSLRYPVIQFRNVFVLPGVPKLVREKFEAIAERFTGPGIYSARVYATNHETAVAGALGEVNERHPAVAIGSYPRFGSQPYNLIVTLESTDPTALQAARDELESVLQTVSFGSNRMVREGGG